MLVGQAVKKDSPEQTSARNVYPGPALGSLEGFYERVSVLSSARLVDPVCIGILLLHSRVVAKSAR